MKMFSSDGIPALIIINYCIFLFVQHRAKMSTTMTRSFGINRKVGNLTHTVTFVSPLQNLVNIVHGSSFVFIFNFNLEKLCWCLNFIVYSSRLTYCQPLKNYPSLVGSMLGDGFGVWPWTKLTSPASAVRYYTVSNMAGLRGELIKYFVKKNISVMLQIILGFIRD